MSIFAKISVADLVATPWTERPGARAILNSFSAARPSREVHRRMFVRGYEEFHLYADPRVDQLGAMRTEALQAVLDVEDLLTREQFGAAIDAQPQVTDAIDRVLAEPIADADWGTALNAKIAGHAARQAEHEAAIVATLADMADRHVEEAEFNARWNAMSYREAVAFLRERETANA